ncbi:NRDE family protein [Massilia sp. W12]|uniref:NRDE family protein n=1 Tax=Massilia sp. W12 TaxID=3126507 RepID=UPI0030D304CC
MCLIVLAWQMVPCAPLIAAANRDEFYARPASPAAWWENHPHVLAGRDLQGGGTWLGVSKSGPRGQRFAALTAVRSGAPKRPEAPTRGELVADFLCDDTITPERYLALVQAKADAYEGFNLLLADREQLIWFSNRSDDARNGQPLAPGIYGLSNAALDTAWPKVVKTKAQFGSLICQRAPADAYFEMLADTARAPDFRLPDTGVPLEWERMLSPVCIESGSYGTRVSSVAKLNRDQDPCLVERLVR